MRYSAIVLAAGSGKRMQSDVKKQYMEILGRPLIYYALHAFQESRVEEIVLVVSPGDEDYVRNDIVERYGISKVSAIIPGGKERYDSVYEGLKAVHGEYVLIHDGARAFLHNDIIERCLTDVVEHRASVVGMPSKDTIKIVDDDGMVVDTPNRALVWNVQTPQCFETELIRQAHAALRENPDATITDDAMVIERLTDVPVHLIEGDYENVKVTTPDDLRTAESILRSRGF
jgi:2-C-methyl-D-erythritol 4-phosphate cytidylyltransferase